jgi:metal-sulfur cluster biosynthetic enzyme
MPVDDSTLMKALATVVDPELGLAITDLGLVRGLHLQGDSCELRLTMTSAACPQGDLIAADAEEALLRVLPPGSRCTVLLEWDPPWTPDAMSERARKLMRL